MIYSIGAQVSSYITMGLLVAAILGAFVGFIHGLRKSVYRLITFVGFVVVAIVLSQTVTEALFNVDIGQYLQKIPNLPAYVNGNTIVEVATSVVEHFVTDTASDATNVILALVSILVKFVYFILMFTVVRWVYNIVTQLLWWIIFKGSKYKLNGKKKSKKRLLGALLTATKGAALYCVMCVILLNGPVSLIPDIDLSQPETQQLSTSEEEKMNELLAQVQEIIKGYKESFMYTAFEGDGTTPSINDTVNNFFWSGSYNGYEVNLYHELSTIVDLGLSAYDIFVTFEDEEVVDYENISKLVKSLANSDLVVTLLPIALEAATQIEAITSKLPENVKLEGLSDINWRQDLENLGDLVMDLKPVVESVDFGGLFADSETTDMLDKIDLSDVKPEEVEKVFATLASISFITKAMDVAVSYALTLDSVQDKLGDLQVDMENLIWKDELTDIGSMLAAFLDLGIRSKADVVDNLNDTINGLDFGKYDEEGYGKVGQLFSAIFASSFVSQVFPNIMEKVVYPMIPAPYQSVFNFEAINTKGWLAEFEALLDIFKTARGKNQEPELFITEKNEFNTKLLKNVTADTILGSDILSNSLQKALIMIKSGEMLNDTGISDMLVMPDKYDDADYNGWKQTSINKYYAQEQVVIDEITYDKYHAISVAEYNALDAQTQAKFAANYKVVSGELYNVVNSLTTVMNILDIERLNAESMNKLLSVETLDELIAPNSKQQDKSNVGVIMDSEILRYSLTSLLTKYLEDTVVIPRTTEVLSSEKVSSITKYALTSQEIESLLIAARKLDIMQTVYVCDDVVVNGLDCYYEGDIISEEVYNSLTDSEKEYVSKKTQFNVSIDIINTLLDCEYVCKVESAPYKVGDIITQKVYEELTLLQQANFEASYTKLDYLLGSTDGELSGSQVLSATISKYIIQQSGPEGLIVVPNTVVASANDIHGSSIQVIDKTELKSLVQTAVKLEIIKTEYACLEAGIYGGVSYEVDNMISKDTYDSLTKEEQKYFAAKGVVKADASLLENLLEVPEGDTYTRLDYVVGSDDEVIQGSKIIHATLSKLILDYDDSEVIVVPDDVITMEGSSRIIEKTELKNVVTAVLKLDIIENGEIHVNIKLVNKLLETPENDDNLKLDYVVGNDKLDGSKILVATLSDLVLEQADNNVLVVPSTAKVNGTRILQNSEIRSLVTAIIKLEILDDSGNIYADLSLLDTLLNVDSNGVTRLDYALDSKIIHATLSDKIMAQEGTIIIPEDVVIVEGDVEVISHNELTNLVTSVIKLGIINEGNIKVDITLLNQLLDTPADDTNTKLDYIVGNDNLDGSRILVATLSDLVLEQADSNVLVVPSTAKVNGTRILQNSEIRSLVTAIIKLEILDDSGNIHADLSLLNTLLDVDSNGVTRLDYATDSKIIHATLSDKIIEQGESNTIVIPETTVVSEGDVEVIEQGELEGLVTSLIKLEIVDNSGNISADIKLINTLLDKPVDDTNVKLDYVVGNSNIDGSDIMLATISDKILQQAESDVIIVPESIVEYLGTKPVLSDLELHNLVNSMIKLEIIDDSGNINADLTLVSKMLYVDSLGITRADYALDSKIMSLTLSKYIVEQSNITNSENVLIIPSTSYQKVDKYSSTDKAYSINNNELKNLLTAIVKLDIVDATGNVNAGLGVVSTLNSKYTYKVEETIDGTSKVDEHEIIYSIIGNDELEGSLIMRATVSKFIYEQKEMLKIFDYVNETHGDAKVLKADEMDHLINAINTMGIIDGDTIKDISEVTTNILSNVEWQRKIDNSIILRATVSSEIIYALYSDDISTTGDAINYICKVGGTYNGVRYEVDDLISYEVYKNLSVEERTKFDKFEEYICNTAFASYEVGDAITKETYVALTPAQRANFTLIEVISEDELMKLFDSLALLDITDFHNASISLNKIFELTDEELDEILQSVLIWDTASHNIENSTSGSDDESVGLLHPMTVEEGIKYRGASWYCTTSGTYNGNSYSEGSVISATAYNDLISHDTNAIGKFEQETSYAFDQELYDVLGVERYERGELTHTLKVFEEIIQDKDETSAEFAIKVEDLEIMYQQPEHFAELLTESILLTYSIKEMMIYSIEHAFSGNASFAFNDAQKTAILLRIDGVNEDMARWKVYEDSVYPDGNALASSEYDGQLVKMLKALNAIKEMNSLSSITSKEELKNKLYTIDNSEVLRFTLETLLVTTGYDEDADSATRKACMDLYVNTLFGSLI